MTQIQPVDFLYKIVTADGVFTLKDSPIGWQEYGTAWERHKERHGYGRKSIAELQFVGDGFDLLFTEYTKYGIEAEAQLEIHKLDRATYEYHLDFVGDIDFSQGTFNLHHGNSYEVQINEAGFAKMLGAKAKDKFEIELPDTILIDKPANALEEVNWAWFAEYNPDKGISRNSYLSIKNADILSNYVEAFNYSENSEPMFVISDVLTNVNGTIISSREKTYNLTLNIIGNVVFEVSPTRDFVIYLSLSRYVQDSNGMYTFNGLKYRRISQLVGYPLKSLGPGQPLNTPIDMSVVIKNDSVLDIAPGIYATFQIFISASSGTASGYFTFEGGVLLSYVGDSLTQPFEIKAISVSALFTKLVDRIKGDVPVITVNSGILTSGIMRDVYVTSGDAVRGIPSAVLKTSFNDFFESLDKVAGVALFIEQSPTFDTDRSYVVSLEAYQNAYRDVEILDLGDVKELTITPDTERMYNYVRMGSANKDYKASNGRFEFNTENDFSLPLTRVTDEKSFIPVYRTDSFGITDLRYSYEKQSTAASDSDNSVWMIHTKVNASGVRIPYADQEILGDALQLERTGIFNLLFTPKRCLIRQQGRFASMLQKIPLPLAVFQTTAKTDAVLTSRLLGAYHETEPVVELSDYIIDVNSAVTLAEIYEFTCVVPQNLATLMSKNVGGYIPFSYQGKRYAGFPEYVSEEPAVDAPQKVKLIAKKL